MDQSASDTGDEQRVVDLELHSVLELLVALSKHGVETLSLRNSSGETIEDETTAGIISMCFLQLTDAESRFQARSMRE